MLNIQHKTFMVIAVRTKISTVNAVSLTHMSSYQFDDCSIYFYVHKG